MDARLFIGSPGTKDFPDASAPLPSARPVTIRGSVESAASSNARVGGFLRGNIGLRGYLQRRRLYQTLPSRSCLKRERGHMWGTRSGDRVGAGTRWLTRHGRKVTSLGRFLKRPPSRVWLDSLTQVLGFQDRRCESRGILVPRSRPDFDTSACPYGWSEPETSGLLALTPDA